MKVLLLEPYYKRKYPPLGLLKISTYHKEKGDEVQYHRGNPLLLEFKPDLIYITSLFTWDFDIVVRTCLESRHKFPYANIKLGGVCATLLHEQLRKKIPSSIEIHNGIMKQVEECKPDYSLFPEEQNSIIFTSRGCPINCPFCSVAKLEQPNIIKNWKEHINLNKKKIIIQDNNIVAMPKEHFIDVMLYLAQTGKEIEFNDGIEVQSLKGWQIPYIAKLKHKPLRLAFDEMKEEKQFISAINKLKDAGIKGDNIMVYVLFNFKDDFEEAKYRAEKVRELGCKPFVMPYIPLDWTSHEKYISPNWTKELINDFAMYYNKKQVYNSTTLEYFISTRNKTDFKKQYKINRDIKQGKQKTLNSQSD